MKKYHCIVFIIGAYAKRAHAQLIPFVIMQPKEKNPKKTPKKMDGKREEKSKWQTRCSRFAWNVITLNCLYFNRRIYFECWSLSLYVCVPIFCERFSRFRKTCNEAKSIDAVGLIKIHEAQRKRTFSVYATSCAGEAAIWNCKKKNWHFICQILLFLSSTSNWHEWHIKKPISIRKRNVYAISVILNFENCVLMEKDEEEEEEIVIIVTVFETVLLADVNSLCLIRYALNCSF